MMTTTPKNTLDPSITVNILYKDWPTVQSYLIQNEYVHGEDYSVVRLDRAMTVIRFFKKALYVDFSNKWEKVIIHIEKDNL